MSRKKFIYLVNLFLILTINLISGYYNFGSNQNSKNSYINVNYYPECKKNFTYTNRQKNKCDISDLYRYLEDSDRPESNRFISGLNNMYFNFMNRSEFIKPIRNILDSYKVYNKHEFIYQFGIERYYFDFDDYNYRSIIRREVNGLPDSEVFIDLNNYNKNGEFYIEDFEISHSLKIMAYKINLDTGFWKIKFKYMNGKDLKDELSINSKTDHAFVLNDAGFIYSNYPTKLASNGEKEVNFSSQILFYHKFGTSQSVDKQIFLSF
ncbi:Prolyl endopeptidase [Strongyloides ratti]|uniref:Prolyl endopeptidase n=1 Tax=Strongyloides ratti TaxID=34506 RepID=A0A090KVP6_STRRB|nr:Prolyl endopeptidase [Strongyloides ratti]CEF59946.2 Prolyl endopeptidase [Strongyloides ratti]